MDCARSGVAVSVTAQSTSRDGARIAESDERDDVNVSLSDYGVEQLTGSLSTTPGMRTRYVRPLAPDHRSSHHPRPPCRDGRSEEHTSELQSQSNLVCRLLLEKKK